MYKKKWENQKLIEKFFSNKFIRGIVTITPEGINGTIAGQKNIVNECLNYIKKKFYIKEFDRIVCESHSRFTKLLYQLPTETTKFAFDYKTLTKSTIKETRFNTVD